MPNALAFLPWIHGDKDFSVGPLRLVQYRHGKRPGDLPHVRQQDIEGVLAAYAKRPGKPVLRATLVEFGEWQQGMDAEDWVQSLFHAVQLLGFSALSTRRLFQQQFGYNNFHAFTLIVQRFEPGHSGRFAFGTRRRDGGTNNMWSSKEFAFHCPLHVDSNAKLDFDETLLQALFLLDGSKRFQPLFEAIREFNYANTDSPDVPEHVEIVMMKSAFEWLWAINQSVEQFVGALRACTQHVDVKLAEGPLQGRWKTRWPSAVRPLEAWGREFCAIRGGAAHGVRRDRSDFVMNYRAHLAFASVLFPLAVKKRLADVAALAISDFDLEHLARIEQYLMNDPFDFDRYQEGAEHPWPEVRMQAMFSAALTQRRLASAHPKPGSKGTDV